MAMKFDSSQMLAMLREDEDFAEWFVQGLMKQTLPNQYYIVSDVGKREMTINGRNYAKVLGFEDFESQAMFVALMWEIGAGFFTFPGFREVADDPNLNGKQKIDAFYAVPGTVAAEAIEANSDAYWYPYMLPEGNPWRPDGERWLRG